MPAIAEDLDTGPAFEPFTPSPEWYRELGDLDIPWPPPGPQPAEAGAS